MSQIVFPLPNVPKRSRGQGKRWNPSTFTEEHESKKMRVEHQGNMEETRRETLTRRGSQQPSGALVRPSPSSVPQMVISEFAILPTQPAPALEFYTDQLVDQSLRRSSAPSCVSIEHALSKFNKDPMHNEYLSRLLPLHAEKGQTVIGICSNLIRSQEEFSAIGSLAQHEGKFCALIIAFGLLTWQVGDQRRTRALTLAKTTGYCMIVTGQENRLWSRLLRTLVRPENNFVPCERKVTGSDWKFACSLVRSLLGDSGICKSKADAYLTLLVKVERWNSRAVRQFGNEFWERVGSLALCMPEADDIATQVGLMYTVLVDAQVLCLHSMSDAGFHWSQDIALRSLISTAVAGEIFSMGGHLKDIFCAAKDTDTENSLRYLHISLHLRAMLQLNTL